jgi:hypothetical protein
MALELSATPAEIWSDLIADWLQNCTRHRSDSFFINFLHLKCRRGDLNYISQRVGDWEVSRGCDVVYEIPELLSPLGSIPSRDLSRHAQWWGSKSTIGEVSFLSCKIGLFPQDVWSWRICAISSWGGRLLRRSHAEDPLPHCHHPFHQNCFN